MPAPAPPDQPPSPPDNGVTFSTFTGLKNTVNPENLTERELSRAQNVDLDDLGQVHRRRGRRLVASGSWHSLFTTTGKPFKTFGVQNGSLVQVNPDFTTTVLLAGIAPDPLAWIQVGPIAYFSSVHNSGQVDIASGIVSPWGRVTSPSYQPGLDPGPEDWWYSPAITPEERPLGGSSVGGRLLGAPPLGAFLTYFNGRIYVAKDRTLWATELYLYNYVDKTKNFRFFESDITGLMSVEDGVYVGTQDALYFLAGTFHEHVRTIREPSGVVPGTMVRVPGELVDPEGRRFPDLPRTTALGMGCMTDAGVVVGLAGGQTYNLTRTHYVFPKAEKGAALFRVEDGMGTLVVPIASGGTPTESARFGDFLSGEIIRAGTPGQPGPNTPSTPVLQQPAVKPVIGGA